MRSKLLTPSIADASWRDGRGAILTFIPEHDLKEFNLVYFRSGQTRGNHAHPHFWEYFMVVDNGNGIFCFIDSETKEKITWHLAKGSCILTPPNVSHAFYALTETTCIACLSKTWDSSKPAIVHDFVTTDPTKLIQVSEK